MKSCCLPTCYISSTVIKEKLRTEEQKNPWLQNFHKVEEKLYGEIKFDEREEDTNVLDLSRLRQGMYSIVLTVFCGSTFAIRVAASIASTEGLQRIGDLEFRLFPVQSSGAVMKSTG